MKYISFNITIWSILLFVACNKKEYPVSDLEIIRKTSNKISYPVAQMDSAQAIHAITKQKVQEVLDLSSLYLSGNKDTEIDSIIYKQLLKYFESPDSINLGPLFNELDSLKVKTAKIHQLEITQVPYQKDTLNNAHFIVEYFDNRSNSLGEYEKNAQYILKTAPEKFKKEFKFYFLNFYLTPPQKDSISVGVTK